jgi:DNA-binding IclR family transcriptional regulator
MYACGTRSWCLSTAQDERLLSAMAVPVINPEGRARRGISNGADVPVLVQDPGARMAVVQRDASRKPLCRTVHTLDPLLKGPA